MSNEPKPPEAGPLEALLLGIALAEQMASPIFENNEDGPAGYMLDARLWLGILERAEQIETRLMLARVANPTRYVPDG